MDPFEEEIVNQGDNNKEVVETSFILNKEDCSYEFVQAILEEIFENVEANALDLDEEEPENIGNSSNENVGYTEELKKKLEDRDDLIISLQKKLEEKESEMNEMKANFRSEISGLVNKLEEKDNEREQAEDALRSQIEEMKRKTETTENHCQEVETLLKSEIELRRKVEEQNSIYRVERRDFKKLEFALRGQVKELKNKDAGTERDRLEVEDTLTFEIELNRKLKKQINIYREERSDSEEAEEALRGEINQVKKKNSRMERDSGKLEDTLPCYIDEQEDERKPTDKDGDDEETMCRQSQHLQVEDGGVVSLTIAREKFWYIYNFVMFWRNIEGCVCFL